MQPFIDFIKQYWSAAFEILLLWGIIYNGYKYFRATRGARIFTALIGMWIGLTLMSNQLNLDVIRWLLERIGVFLAIGLVVIFQPELRRALAELGSHRWFSSFTGEGRREFTEHITGVIERLARRRVGALIAIQRSIELTQYLETGVTLDAKLSNEVVETIFHSGTILHDGGLIVRLGDERILGAGCVFPLNQRELADRSIGLRHRAAMGITEESDAIALVVSEETGAISIAIQGQLERDLSIEKLGERLNELFFAGDDEEDEDEEVNNESAPA